MSAAPYYRWVFFDAGGTLLGTNTDSPYWYQQFFVDACRELGHVVAVDQVSGILRQAEAECRMDRRCSTPEQVRQYWHHVYSAAFSGLAPGHDAEAAACHYISRFETGEFVQLFSDTRPSLDALASAGIRLGIVSNFGTYLEAFLAQTGIADYFDFAVISAAAGCEKPQPEIYQMALARAGASASEVLFVGDSLQDDYEAPTSLGFSAVLVDRYDMHASKPAVRRIQSLVEIADLFA